MPFLLHLNISLCELKEIRQDFFESLINLRILDLSFNRLRAIQSNAFASLISLVQLHFVGNLEVLVIEQEAFSGLKSLHELSLIGFYIESIAQFAFEDLDLFFLEISFCNIDQIDDVAFGRLKVNDLYLNTSDIVKFDKGMFNGLEVDHTIVTDEYKFCCIRPSLTPEENCYPPKDEFSSCSNLMDNVALRSLIWIIAALSLLGNCGTFIYRITKDRGRLNIGFGVFVTNLAVSDFMMGTYLIIIACADTVYRGIYIFEADTWRQGTLCHLAGILAALSSESAALFIILITIDRILVVKFPFGQVKFMRKSALITCGLVWILSLFIATFPVMYKPYFKDQFYSKTGVCLALPLTADKPPGWVYAFVVFIVFNTVTFILIAAGQILIHQEIAKQRKKMATVKTGRSNDLTILKNLLLVVATDFLCWFPIGIIGKIFPLAHGMHYVVISSTAHVVLSCLIFWEHRKVRAHVYNLNVVLYYRPRRYFCFGSSCFMVWCWIFFAIFAVCKLSLVD